MQRRRSFFLPAQSQEVVRAGPALQGEVVRAAKMLLDLSEEHKEHLAFLPQVDIAGKGMRGVCGRDIPRDRPALKACSLPLQWSPSSGGSRWSSSDADLTRRSTKAPPVRRGGDRLCLLRWKVLYVLSLSPAGTFASPRVLYPLQPIKKPHSCQSGRQLCK